VPANNIGELGDFATKKDFLLHNGTALTIVGAVTAGAPMDGTVAATSSGGVTIVNSANVTVQGDISARQPGADGISLSATGAASDITQSGGTLAADGNVTIAAGRNLTFSGGLVTAGGTLAASAGAGSLIIFGSAGITAYRDIALSAGAGISQSGGMVGGYNNGTLTAADTFSQTDGTLAVTNAVSINAATGVGQTGGAIFADTLAMTTNGDADLSGTGMIGGSPTFTHFVPLRNDLGG
jgi:filamentous hemagglutinin